VPISRPDDFFAEMMKNDTHMVKVKSRLLRQQVKIKTFEEKKLKQENKKFHKALKDFKMKNKHNQKRENLEMITQLKQKIKEKGDDMDDKDFAKIMKTN
jgi:rRNA-processing protein EBP2